MDTDKKSEKNISGVISINLTREDENATKTINIDMENTLVLPTRNLVLFPGIALPIQLGRESSVMAAEYAKSKNVPLAVFCQLSPDTDDPSISDLYEIGTLARVIDIIELPDGVKTVIVEGVERVRLLDLADTPLIPNVLSVKIESKSEKTSHQNSLEFQATIEKIREITKELVKFSFDDMSKMQFPQIDKITDPSALINNIVVHIPLDVFDKQLVLDADSIDERAQRLLRLLLERQERMNIMHDILDKTKTRMDQCQRNAFLQQQMDVIRTELEGDESDELDELYEKAKQTSMPNEVRERFNKELRKLRRYNPQSPDYAVQYTYLDTLLTLPWAKRSDKAKTISGAQRIMDRDHYGLRKIKDRVLEQLALIMNNPEGQAPIVCFVGPPGVGKTSLGKSIAEALGRKFHRVSLGGLHDEAEIRGHRRTYIGAMPGRIIEAMRRAGTLNPVIMLDEIDKIGSDFKGDPAAALLEVLDPAQNCKFHDNYIDIDYDLSNVLFIATANTLSTISKPLLDRIEVIEIGGYTMEEKTEIAVRHLLPKLRLKHNISESTCSFDKGSIKRIIEDYTSESGVRELEKKLEAVLRKKLLHQLRHPRKKFDDSVVKEEDLPELLGAPIFRKDKCVKANIPGVVTGLAWTSVGGEILLVEAALSQGKGNLILTGNLGDIMKESATLALEWVKVNASELGIDYDVFKNNDFHIHFPEGAIPKDGPSAGITIVTALVSAIKKKAVKSTLAMTGEISLRGKVLPVGGIKEKLLAAVRAGVKTVILSQENQKDIAEIESRYLRGLKLIQIENIMEVLNIALA